MPGFLRIILFAVLPIGLIIGGTVAGVGYMASNRPKPVEAREAPKGLPVFVAQAERADVTLSVRAQGEVRAQREIDIVPQVGGLIVEVSDSFNAGGNFQAGDLLVRIEPADYRLAVTRAEAAVAQSKRALEREFAEAELAAMDWAELGEGEASALTLREPQLAEALANVASAEAALEEAKLRLERTAIRAPFEGRLREKFADLGQFVSPGQRLARIFSTDVVEVRLPLTDSDLELLNLPLAFTETADTLGPEVILSAELAGQQREWRGRVTRTDGALNASTRSLGAIVEVQDPYGAGASDGMPLAVGVFVEAHITGRSIAGAYVLPRAALRGENTMLIADEDTATLSVRTVTVASSTRERVIVTSGVAEGEYVITSPVLSVQEGMAIQALDPSGARLFPPEPEPETEDADEDAVTDEAATALVADEEPAGERT